MQQTPSGDGEWGRALVPLDRQKIVRWAQVEAVHPAFGDQAPFFHLLESFFAGFAENTQLSAMGTLGITDWAKSCLFARRECMNYVAAHPEVLSQKIEKPVVIVGMHRTGSTLLYNLLHQDPKTRSTFMHEMYGAWPHLPVATSRAAQYQDHRMVLLKQRFERAFKLLPEGSAKRQRAHPSSPDMIEEDFIIASHQLNWFTPHSLVERTLQAADLSSRQGLRLHLSEDLSADAADGIHTRVALDAEIAVSPSAPRLLYAGVSRCTRGDAPSRSSGDDPVDVLSVGIALWELLSPRDLGSPYLGTVRLFAVSADDPAAVAVPRHAS
jgi:hypothetical protein